MSTYHRSTTKSSLSHRERAGCLGQSEASPQSLAAYRLPPTAYRLPPTARRGVLLLVVLILLVMFVMMAVTYVLVASKQLSNNRALARSESTGDPPAQQLDGVAMQVFRGSTNQHSVLYPHSLLEHMYGPYGLTGSVSAGPTAIDPNGNSTRTTPGDPSTDQILEFTGTSPAPVDAAFYDPVSTSTNSWSHFATTQLYTEGYLDGCVITMTSGPAKGLSSRIVRYDATDPANPVFHTLPFKGAGGVKVPQANDTFLINGRAFSGTGFGFNPGTGVLDAKNGDDAGNPNLMPGGRKEFAFLPNPLAFHPLNPTEYGITSTPSDYDNSGLGTPFSGIGGANTDYDAPDYQHMAMSWTVMNTATGQPVTILPSFHRPDLINYWTLRIKNAIMVGAWQWNPTDPTVLSTYQNIRPESRDLLRQILLRPMGPMTITPVGGPAMSLPSTAVDHPNFTGSNPGFDAINGPWDVDNDGDGVADSVWIDAGYPVQTSTDGKMYKPLFAILCVDLDGRLNVNAAGTTEQLTRFDPTTGQDQKITAGPYAGGTQQPLLPRGIGIGPADDNILQFYSSLLQQYGVSSSTAWTAAPQAATVLLQGGTINSVPYDGRYGDFTSTSNPLNAPPQAGKPGVQSLMGEVMRFQYPNNNFDPVNNVFAPLSSFGSPSDIWGRMAIGLDYRGQPLYWKATLSGQSGWAGEVQNNPYDLNLNAGGSYQASSSQSDDNPFGAMELERLCRQFDVDSAGLPRRLWDLSGAGPLMNNPALLNFTSTAQSQTVATALGHTVTTDSWDSPSPGVVAPKSFRDPNQATTDILQSLYGRRFATSIVELLTARLKAENPTMTQAQINYNIRQLLSPELIAGLRMNVNRPLGDGRDGNNNGVVDEPSGTGYGPPYDNGSAETATEGRNSSANQWSWINTALANAGFQSPPALDLAGGIDVNGDGVVNGTDQLLARQLFARHLYVLARLMIDDEALKSVKWFSNDSSVNSDPTKIQKLAIRRIAQWAVNVVDNMDPDNIMTPFEYDTAPFTNIDASTGQRKNAYRSPPNGPYNPDACWAVDGQIDSDPTNTQSDDGQSWRGLVWGCEQPSLLITETMALHDRRVADTKNDTTGKDRSQTPNPDADLDQVRIPEGSLFVELYATHNPNNPTASGDLYVKPTNTSPWCLNLEAFAPAGNDGFSASAQYPVWRLAISKPHVDKNGSTTIPSPRTLADPSQANSAPASASFEPEQYIEPDPDPTKNYNVGYNGSLLDTTSTGNRVQLDRYVWFWRRDPTTVAAHDADRIFWQRQVNNVPFSDKAYIQPGGYVVVGPRDQTWFGSLTASEGQASTWMQKWGVNSSAGISLSQMAGVSGVMNKGVTAVDATGSYPDTTQIQMPVTIVAGANPPPLALWPNRAVRAPANGIGISVSEPLPDQPGTEANRSDYYPEPTNQNLANNSLWDAYDNLQSPTGTFRDTPFESARAAASGRIANAPLSLLGTKTGTTMNYRTVFLQRLANPLAPYHPLTNPYLTVDWMPVDLTVFNGEDRKPGGPSGWDDSKGPWDPDDVNKSGFDNYNDQDKSVAFSSRQRGQFSTYKPNSDPTKTTIYTNLNLWSQWPDPTIKATTATPTSPNLLNLGGEDPALNLREDRNLGTVNFRFNLNDTTAVSDTTTIAGVGNASLGFLNHSYGPPSDSTAVNGNSAYIGDPNPNSPVNPGRTFPWLVWNNRPYANIAELMLVPASSPGRLLNEFGCNWSGANVYNSNDGANKQLQSFPHLLNFFSSAQPQTATNTTSPASTGHVGLSQMFEYLQIPSPFVGTQQALNPINFAGDWWMAAGAKPGELSPGNEPAGTAGLHPPFNFVSSYRDPGKVNINTVADTSVWNAVLGGDPTPPSTTIGPQFSTVVTSRQGYGSTAYAFDSAHPSIFSRPFHSGAAADMAPLDSLKQSAAEATVFRGADANSNVPMLMGTFPKNSYNDGIRNPYFTFQGLENITGKLTTRSNVYAVWITVGYFEVTPWYGINPGNGLPNTTGAQVFDTAHPDGYQLGQEVGADSGQIQRHRAFYIIDRSIPVGFQRGYDNNDSNAVILKRFIE